MGRIVGIDYGTKRVGLAVTDPLKIFATPLETVHAKDVILFLKQLDQKEGIEAFVLGMPKKLDNTDTGNTRFVQGFEKQLAKHFPGKRVHLIDERFTSKIAMDTMLAGGMKKKDRQNKSNVDKISAVLILQSYLESKKI